MAKMQEVDTKKQNEYALNVNDIQKTFQNDLKTATEDLQKEKESEISKIKS